MFCERAFLLSLRVFWVATCPFISTMFRYSISLFSLRAQKKILKKAEPYSEPHFLKQSKVDKAENLLWQPCAPKTLKKQQIPPYIPLQHLLVVDFFLPPATPSPVSQ